MRPARDSAALTRNRSLHNRVLHNRVLRTLLMSFVAMAAGFAPFAATPAAAHTGLVSAKPAKNGTVDRAPFTVRLVFNEPIETKLATIVIINAAGDSISLVTRADPRDVRAVLAEYAPADTGSFKLDWHVVSADGHPVKGSYSFRVTGQGAPAPPTVPHADSSSLAPGSAGDDSVAPAGPGAAADALQQSAASPATLPLRLALLRAAASFATLATAGVLAFLAWLLPPVQDERRRRARMRLSWLATAALLFSFAHTIAWAGYATSYSGFAAAQAALMSAAARAECARVIFCALTVWALILVRNARWAAVTALCAMLATAAIGHAAAIQPALLIPIKAVHLATAALWLGGLIILAVGPEQDDPAAAAYANVALRVSVVALTSVVLITLSGIAQTLLVLKPAQLFTTAYGLLSLGKVGVLIILIGFGVANRLRNVPAVQRGEAVHVLKRTVAWEIAVVAVAFIIAGVLAYTSPPERANDPANGRATGSAAPQTSYDTGSMETHHA